MKKLHTTQALVAAVSTLGVFWAVAQDTPPDVAPEVAGENTAEVGPDPATLEEADPAATGEAVARAADGPAYAVSAFEFAYLADHRDLPTPDQIDDISVRLLPTATGYVAPRPGADNQTIRIGDVNEQPLQIMHASAVNQVAAAVVRDFNNRGYLGVLVAPDPSQISGAFSPEGVPLLGQDMRGENNTVLRLNIFTKFVSELRTVASGDRIPTEDRRVNHRFHERILDNSPIVKGDLVNRAAMNDYLYDLNRHPGRYTASSVSGGINPEDTVIDYLVSEAKPWTAFFNLSNTGTRDTREWRERFGLLHTQFTGNDDIFSLEYVTAGFEDSHAVFTSYERPFADNDRVHWRVYGTFQDFEASDVGFPGADFDGTEYGVGGELIWNFFQDGPSFLDLVAGARWESVHVNNRFAAIEETEPFFVPYVGVAFENTTQVNTTTAYFGVEFNLDGVAGTDSPDLDGLGRLNTDADWVKFPFSVAHSFYLEPILNREDWLNISTPGSTLAHEVFVAFRGQWVPDSRLNPQSQEVLGGLYTVRGYDEAITAGDTVLIATAEYRLHIPRLFTPTPGQQRPVTQFFGEPFRTFPQEPYGTADWDLVGKAFIDVGRSLNNDRAVFEQNETLVGAGLGVDILFKRNANFRMDWGVALEDAADTTSGSQQFHFSFTLLY